MNLDHEDALQILVANEYDPDSKAAREVLQLYNYTVQFVDSSRESHGKAKPAHARA